MLWPITVSRCKWENVWHQKAQWMSQFFHMLKLLSTTETFSSTKIEKTSWNTGLSCFWTRPLNINAPNSHVQVAKTSRVSEQWPTNERAVTLCTRPGRHSKEEALIGALEKVWADISSFRQCTPGTVTAHWLHSEATWLKTCFVIPQNVHAGMELWCLERSFGPRDYSRLRSTSGEAGATDRR